MTNYQVINKWIVSPNGKVISQVKSVAASIGNNTEISQSVSVNASADGCSSFSSSSSTSSNGTVSGTSNT